MWLIPVFLISFIFYMAFQGKKLFDDDERKDK